MNYNILVEPVIHEIEIKKSRFITYLAHADSIDKARAFWQEIKLVHPNARHHCWAAVAGAPSNSLLYGFSDDGEPSGTAGKPMLNCLAGSEIGEVSAVVVRYFGGILLGTGGLVKAYATSVQQSLQLANVIEKIPQIPCQLICTYPQLDWLLNVLSQFKANIIEQTFNEQVCLTFSIHPDDFDSLNLLVRNRTSGQLQITRLEV